MLRSTLYMASPVCTACCIQQVCSCNGRCTCMAMSVAQADSWWQGCFQWCLLDLGCRLSGSRVQNLGHQCWASTMSGCTYVALRVLLMQRPVQAQCQSTVLVV